MPPPPQPTLEELVYELRWKIAKSYAASFRFNPRNLEAHWDGLWQIVLNFLVRHRSDFLVIPQFALYHIRPDDDGDDEERKEGENPDDPDNVGKKDTVNDELKDDMGDLPNTRQTIDEPTLPANPPPRSPTPPIPESPILRALECVTDPDDSMRSFATTAAPQRRTSTFIPDFCIFHLCTIASLLLGPDSFRYYALGGLQVTHTCCPVIVENKRSPKRKLRGDQFVFALLRLLSEAMDGLYDQCDHYFKMFPKSISVVAIAASGAHWKYRIVHFGEFEVKDDEKGTHKGKEKKTQRKDATDLRKAFYRGWSKSFEIGTPESDRELNALQTKLFDSKPEINL